MVSQFEKECIIKAYFDEVNDNPHTRFAELVGMDRTEAKILFYKWSYTNPLLRMTINARPNRR